MIDLPDHGYVSARIAVLDAGGPLDGSLGGPSDYINRPGMRYAVTYQLRSLNSADDARKLQSLLEQGAQEDVSYPWPLDYRPPPATVPLVNGASPAGSVIPINGLTPNYPFRAGQPLAVISGGLGFIHRVTTPQIADGTGAITLAVFPWTRTAFADNDVIEIERPRIRGMLSWEPPTQGSFGARPFQFTITERR